MMDEQAAETGPCVRRRRFGTLADGRAVDAITLADARGLQVTLIAYGAGIQAVRVPDRQGRFADIALGHATLEPYVRQPQYLGSTVGRVANRIAGGRFTLDGQAYRVPANNGPNALHGGPAGFDTAVWDVLALADAPVPMVRFGHVSPDGDQGFPGRLTATATYALHDDALHIDYAAETDRPTIVNLTNHVYWNLAGEGAPGGAMDHLLTLHADAYLPTDETSIPSGEIRPVAGTPFDFRAPTPVGARVRDASEAQIRAGRGYDHNWVLADPAAPLPPEPRLAARLVDPGSGRMLELWTDQPGVQFYSGNFLDGTSIGKAGQLYRMGDAVVLEPQAFPDTPNHPHFGSLRLAPGQVYRNRIVWRFGLA